MCIFKMRLYHKREIASENRIHDIQSPTVTQIKIKEAALFRQPLL